MALGITELLVTLGVGAALLGRKDLPRAARVVGQVGGSAVHHLRRMRDSFTGLSEINEIRDAHKELREGLSQLREIRAQLRAPVSFQGGVGQNREQFVAEPLPKKTAARAEQSPATSAGKTSTRSSTTNPDASAMEDVAKMFTEIPVTAKGEPLRTDALPSGADILVGVYIDRQWAKHRAAERAAALEQHAREEKR